MRIYPELKISIGLILSFALVVAGGGYAYINSSRAIEYGKSVKKGLEQLAALESLLQVTKTNQKAAILYATTGNVSYREKFEKSISRVNPHIQYIKGKAAKDKRRYILLTGIETQLRGFNNQISSLVIERKTTGKNFEISEGVKNDLDSKYELIRGRVYFIESEEQELLKRKISLYERESKSLFTTYSILAVMVALFFLGLIFTLVRYTRTTRQAAEAEQRIASSVFKFAPIGILILNEKLEVQSSNPMFTRFINDEEYKGKSVLELIPDLPNDVVDYLDMFTESWGGVQSAKELKEARVFQDRYFDLVLWPMLNEEEQKGIIMLFLDTTDKVNLDKQKQLLLNTFTHDLKNPLIGNQYLLKAINEGDNNLESDQREILENLNRGTEDVLRMVTNILNIAKLQDHSQTLNLTEFNTINLIDESIDSLKTFWNSKGIAIEKELPEEAVLMNTDKNLMKHLLVNLLSNAIKFSNENDVVTVSLTQESDIVAIGVSDQGPGISESDKKKLFTKTWQGELGLAVPGGTGIGLYLCSQIAQALKGAIKCESSGGVGTKFIVKIPRVLQSEISHE